MILRFNQINPLLKISIGLYYVTLYAYSSLAQAVLTPVSHILGVDILNIFHHLCRTVAYNVHSASKTQLAHL